MSVTLLVFHALKFKLVRDEQLLNMLDMLITLLVLKFSIPVIVVSFEQSRKTVAIVVTLLVFQPLRLRLVKLEQFAKSSFNAFGLNEVAQPLKSKLVKLGQLLNIPATFPPLIVQFSIPVIVVNAEQLLNIYVALPTLLKFQPVRLIVVILVHPANIQ